MQDCVKMSQPFVTYCIYTVYKPFSRMQTSTDLTATKLFSRNREGMFRLDGTRAHKSKATIAWLDANINHYIPLEDWPPNSLDLSPIENVWNIMTTAVYADPEPQSLQTLKHRLRKAWKSISLHINTSKSYRFDA